MRSRIFVLPRTWGAITRFMHCYTRKRGNLIFFSYARDLNWYFEILGFNTTGRKDNSRAYTAVENEYLLFFFRNFYYVFVYAPLERWEKKNYSITLQNFLYDSKAAFLIFSSRAFSLFPELFFWYRRKPRAQMPISAIARNCSRKTFCARAFAILRHSMMAYI